MRGESQMKQFQMYQCLNPDCLHKNPAYGDPKFCLRCGSKLLLAERYIAVEIIGQGGFGRTFKAIDRYQFDEFCVIKQFLPLTKVFIGDFSADKLCDRIYYSSHLLQW